MPEIKAEFRSTFAEDIIEEMMSMGIKTLEALDKIIPTNLKQVYVDKSSLSQGDATFTELIRIILIIDNIEAYFTKAFKSNSIAVNAHFLEILQAFGKDISKHVTLDDYSPYSYPGTSPN